MSNETIIIDTKTIGEATVSQVHLPQDDTVDEFIEGLKNLPSKPGTIPAADYVVAIKDAQVKSQDNGAYNLVILNMAISTGEFKGHHLTKYYHLKSQKALDFFRKEMTNLGVVVTGEHELPDLGTRLANATALVTVVFNESGNMIIYIKPPTVAKKTAAPKVSLSW